MTTNTLQIEAVTEAVTQVTVDKHYFLYISTPDGDMLMTIDMDGHVEHGPAYSPEAFRQFATSFPSI